MLGSSVLVTASILMDMGQEESMGMEMHSIMSNRKVHNLVVQCLSSFGKSAMSTSSTVSSLAMIQVYENSSLTLEEVFVKDPPLWSINIMKGTNMWFNNLYVNGTAVNVPYGTNKVQIQMVSTRWMQTIPNL